MMTSALVRRGISFMAPDDWAHKLPVKEQRVGDTAKMLSVPRVTPLAYR